MHIFNYQLKMGCKSVTVKLECVCTYFRPSPPRWFSVVLPLLGPICLSLHVPWKKQLLVLMCSLYTVFWKLLYTKTHTGSLAIHVLVVKTFKTMGFQERNIHYDHKPTHNSFKSTMKLLGFSSLHYRSYFTLNINIYKYTETPSMSCNDVTVIMETFKRWRHSFIYNYMHSVSCQ